MVKDYTTYTADQLLNDDFFLQSEQHPTPDNQLFWANLEQENESLAKELKIARNFLAILKKNASQSPLSPKGKQETWNRIHQENRKHDTRHIRHFKTGLSIAASIALLIGIAYYYLLPSNEQDNATDYLAILGNTQQAGSPSGEVQLILSDNEKIAIDGKETQVEYHEDGTLNINAKEEKKLHTDENSNLTKIFNQLIVPAGKRSTITFQDGTKLWVNSGSKVIYPVNFDKDKREIFAEGEIFLDVSHDNQRPFVVKTKELDVMVLGTQFNLSTYKTEKQVEVVLVSGKVEVQTHRYEKSVLTPNQLFSYNTETHKRNIKQVDISEYIAWKDGYYQFTKQNLEVVLRKISQYYEIDIQWSPKLNELSCSGKLDLKNDLDEVLNALQKAAPIKITQNQEKIYIDVKPLN
ncbi:MAG: FecR domain-containing protein [Tannerella sp.]|jgi:hypothetical protein|nr:FecR domain-containing protein [Tannerella sp.]